MKKLIPLRNLKPFSFHRGSWKEFVTEESREK